MKEQHKKKPNSRNILPAVEQNWIKRSKSNWDKTN